MLGVFAFAGVLAFSGTLVCFGVFCFAGVLDSPVCDGDLKLELTCVQCKVLNGKTVCDSDGRAIARCGSFNEYNFDLKGVEL